MKACSADKTIVHLSFNETDLDRILPVDVPESDDEVANETIDVDVPIIRIEWERVDQAVAQRLSVVDVRALV